MTRKTAAHAPNNLACWGLRIKDGRVVDDEGVDNPEFTDAPGLRRNFGIKRSLAYNLLSRGLIRGVSLRQPGALRGKRLFHVGSVRDYLFSQLEDQQGAKKEDTVHAVKLAPVRKAAAAPHREKVIDAPASRAKGGALKKSPVATRKATAKKIGT